MMENAAIAIVFTLISFVCFYAYKVLKHKKSNDGLDICRYALIVNAIISLIIAYTFSWILLLSYIFD